MRLIKNTGRDRVIDELRQALAPLSSLDLASPEFSLFAFAEIRDLLEKLDACRLVLPAANGGELGLTGSDTDRAFRNRLQLRWLARECGAWMEKKVELRGAPGKLPQSILIAGKPETAPHRVITGKVVIPGDKIEDYLKALAEAEKAREPFRWRLEGLREEFSSYLAAKYAKKTVSKHTWIVEMFVEFICRQTDVGTIEEITRGMVNTHFRQWYRRKVLDSATPDELRGALKKFFQFLETEKGISNPKVLEALQ